MGANALEGGRSVLFAEHYVRATYDFRSMIHASSGSSVPFVTRSSYFNSACRFSLLQAMQAP
eukprot:1158502-Pelagomonas_calceolata.AAC.7